MRLSRVATPRSPRPLRSPPPRAAAATTFPTSLSPAVADFATFLEAAQADLLTAVERLDGSGATFRRDAWRRGPDDANPGAGVTAVLEGGAVIEKGAASTTFVSGVLSPGRAAALASRGVPAAVAGGRYSAAALSMVFHPANPHVPTLRGDVRVFSLDSDGDGAGGGGVAWFGGGCDLTPAILYRDDVAAFHAHWAGVCAHHDAAGGGAAGSALYAALKRECDAYFYIPARREHRGVGGVFFDGAPAGGAAAATGGPVDAASPLAAVDGGALARDVAAGWLPSWAPIVAARRGAPFTDAQREWQLLRRGRYVEFNLIYDRGVRFGLDGGRVEAVMVSAPPLVRWAYDVVPAPGTPEAELVDVLRTPREWV